ncbi:MAG: class I tRNA ligase family protein, partial [Lentimonas sp.]
AIDAYRLDFAAQALYDFVWNEYCDWYLELSKPVLWDEAGDPSLIAGTRKTLIEILEQTLRLLHPLMPYITEEIWQSVAPIAGSTGKTIMLQGYPLADADMIDEEAEAEIDWLKQLIVAIRTVRSEANLAPSLELNVLIKNTNASDRERMERNAPFLKKLAKTASLEALDSDDETPPALSALCGHMEILVPMAGVIDIEAELARLSKEHEKQKIEVQRLESKLENPKFIDRAPTDVVDKEREKLSAASDALGKLEEQVKRIQGLR